MKVLTIFLMVISLTLLSGCKVSKPKQEFYVSQNAMAKPSYHGTSNSVKLNIPNLNWDRFVPGVDTVGWCGEASIQMIALYYGYYHSQKTINQLGEPQHLDLYSNEIEKVMKKLGFQYSSYVNQFPGSVDHYVGWVKDNLAQKAPVFSGIKRNPSGNPNWSVDHFIVVVGYGQGDIEYNSNNESYGRVKLDEALFKRSGVPYTLRNPVNSYFGFSVKGVDIPKASSPNSQPVRLFVLGETADKVDIGIRVEGLIEGENYTINRKMLDINSNKYDVDPSAHVAMVFKRFIATDSSMTFADTDLPKHNSFYYEVL